MGLGCFLCFVITVIDSELDFMSITVIYKGEESKRRFFIIKSTFLLPLFLRSLMAFFIH